MLRNGRKWCLRELLEFILMKYVKEVGDSDGIVIKIKLISVPRIERGTNGTQGPPTPFIQDGHT